MPVVMAVTPAGRCRRLDDLHPDEVGQPVTERRLDDVAQGRRGARAARAGPRQADRDDPAPGPPDRQAPAVGLDVRRDLGQDRLGPLRVPALAEVVQVEQ